MMFRRCCGGLAALGLLLSLSHAEEAEPIRVACVGDSITAGAGAGRGQDYPSQLAALLGDGYLVRNFGVSGATALAQGNRPYIRRPEFRQALAFSPHVVILKLGTNDSKPQNWRLKEQFAGDLGDMIEKFAALDSQPTILLGLPAPVARDNFGIRQSVMDKEIRPLVKRLAAEKKLGAIDFYAALKDHPKELPDGVHPNGAGYRRMAEAAAKAVKAAGK